jgi:hypothetical protein
MPWHEWSASAYVEFQSMTPVYACEALWKEAQFPLQFQQPLPPPAKPSLAKQPPLPPPSHLLPSTIISKHYKPVNKPHQPKTTATLQPPAKPQPYAPDQHPLPPPPLPPPTFTPPTLPPPPVPLGTSESSKKYRSVPSKKRRFESDEMVVDEPQEPKAPAEPKAMPLPLSADEQWAEHLIPDSMRLQPGEKYPFPLEVPIQKVQTPTLSQVYYVAIYLIYFQNFIAQSIKDQIFNHSSL